MLSGEETTRRERLAKLREQGVDPYPSTSSRTHAVADALAAFANMEASQTTFTIAGRVLAIRQMGGLTFSARVGRQWHHAGGRQKRRIG